MVCRSVVKVARVLLITETRANGQIAILISMFLSPMDLN